MKLNYRFGDCIRHNNVPKPKQSLAVEYYKLKNSDPIDYDTLYNVVIDSSYNIAPKKSLVVHLRLFDWIWWPNGGNMSIQDYVIFSEKNTELLKSLDNIFIMYGCTRRDKEDESEKFVQDLITHFKTINENTSILSTNNTDQDFKTMISTEYYMPSMGGYGTLGAALNKNTVFWDISDKYYHTYKSLNELRDLKLFKENYYKHKYHNNKTAIIGLASGYEQTLHYKTLIGRNKELEKNNQKDIDYIIFYNGNISLRHQTHIYKSTPDLLIKFVDVSKNENVNKTSNELGKHNKHNFWFCDFWKYLEKYDKIIRIDEDVIYKNNVLDMFSFIENKVCCYDSWQEDCQIASVSLNNFTINYFKEVFNKEIKSFPKGGPYTNVLGLNLGLLRNNKDLFGFIKAIYESNNIYIDDWCDSQMWGIVLQLLYNTEDYVLINKN
jgi:hypothetical protein